MSALIKTTEMTPAIYSQESRDFQIYLRLYDTIFNMLKFDTDEVKDLTNTELIRSEMLPLLQTKLGFFTNYSIPGDQVRSILKVFPLIVRNKGTMLGIRQAVRAFLNIYNLSADLDIYYTTTAITQGSLVIPDHTVVVGVTEKVDSFYILEELFRYILPAGYGSLFYYYSNISDSVELHDKHTVYRLTVGQDVNSSIRYKISPESLPVFSPKETYKRNTLIRQAKNATYAIYRCIKDIDKPGECAVSDNWSTYWEIVNLEQASDGKYQDSIREVLLNSVDTILVYSTRESSTNGADTELSDTFDK